MSGPAGTDPITLSLHVPVEHQLMLVPVNQHGDPDFGDVERIIPATATATALYKLGYRHIEDIDARWRTLVRAADIDPSDAKLAMLRNHVKWDVVEHAGHPGPQLALPGLNALKAWLTAVMDIDVDYDDEDGGM